ncbi:MAG: host specificity factor TipJ family phage tail protein, partial [Chloroflexota bacterium]|nr:host specificity factor TipJ family phage tail protein [Chloroflexota bacterium]
MALGEGATKGVSVDVWPHPLTSEGQHDAVAPAGVTLGQAVRDAGLGSRPVRAWIDGREVDAEIMDGRALAEGEIVTLRADVRGGGGGGGNKVLRTILSIAVLAAAVFVPPLLGFAAGTVGGALASAGVLVAGNLLVNALVPPEIPRLDGPGTDRSTPVYSLAGGANRARLYAPLLCVLGSHRVFPDLAAAEYQTFEDGEQFLHQIFDFGVGDIDVTDLKSGAQALSGFDGVTEYRALGGGRITRIAGNVDTIAGAQLEDTNAVSRTAPACTSFQVDLVARVFSISDKGETEENSVSVEISWSAPGQAGGSVTRTIGTQSQAKDGETVFVQDQRRMTVTQELPALADWQVSVRRTTAPSDDDRTYDDVAFTALRAFQPDTGDYAGRNRIGVRFKASAQLQGRLDRISGTVHQKVPDLVGGSWSAPRRTSNPASVFRWIALGVREGGAPWMGLHLAASRLDDAQMRAWHAWCAAEGLACNFVVDRERTVDDLLRLVARCGRASPTWQSGRLGVVFDRAGQAPTALVTPGNVVQGSFGVEWASAAVAEEIAVRYVEPMLDWQWNTVRKTVPGVSGTPASTVTQTLEGVTSAAQAAAEAGLLAARHAYQRRRLTWEMSAEGLAIRRGQVLNVTHSLIDGGVTGRLKGGGTDQVQLDREVTLTGDDWIALRLHDGTVHTSRVTAGAAADRLRLATPLRLPASDPERPALDVLWRLYDSAEPPLRAKVISTEPLSDRAVRMVAIDEDPRYYAGKNAAPDSVD